MNERVKLRIDGRVVEVTLVEKPKSTADDGTVTRHWAVKFDDPIEFEEHFEPKIEVEKRGVWIGGSWEGIPKKGGSTTGFIAFTDPE